MQPSLSTFLTRILACFARLFAAPACLLVVFTTLTGSPTTQAEPLCPIGFRLHYQGFCINRADEQKDDQSMGVRTVEPVLAIEGGHSEIEPSMNTWLSNMVDKAYCRSAYRTVFDGKIGPVGAIAFGKDSCGVSDPDLRTEEEATSSALEKCRWSTSSCKIVLMNSNE